MSTETDFDAQLEHEVLSEQTGEERIERRLSRIETEVRKVGESTRRTNAAYGIFAALAVLIAGANLVAVAAKLGGKETTRTVTVNAPAAAAPVAPAAVHTTNVALREFTIAPSPAQVSAGKVKFTVNNAGGIKHEFVVLRTDKSAASLLKGSEADETGNVGEIPGVAPGQTKTLTLTLKQGHYALICNLPGHYKAGQHADLTVR
jgi:uncharacterized cupredoxin-like copper-binding protein